MTIGKVFNYIKGGKDPNKLVTRVSDRMDVKKIQKDSMKSSKFITSRFVDIKLPAVIDDKYFLQDEDIIISLKEPYIAAAMSETLEEKVLIPNNYVVLRNIDKEKYNYIFVVNYLNLFGINKLINKNVKNDIYTDLTINDIKSIVLPNISLEKQETVITLCNAINQRAVYYETIMDNDKKIIEYAMKEVLGGRNV